jgi:hypothetical protein
MVFELIFYECEGINGKKQPPVGCESKHNRIGNKFLQGEGSFFSGGPLVLGSNKIL